MLITCNSFTSDSIARMELVIDRTALPYWPQKIQLHLMDFTKCKIAAKCLEKKLLHMFLCVSLFFLHYESSTIVKAYIQFKALLKIERLRKQMRVSDEHNQ